MKKNMTAPIITTMAVGTALGAAYMFTNKKHSTKTEGDVLPNILRQSYKNYCGQEVSSWQKQE